MHESGGRVLAIESGMTIILDELRGHRTLVDKLGIAIVAVSAVELEMRAAG